MKISHTRTHDSLTRSRPIHASRRTVKRVIVGKMLGDWANSLISNLLLDNFSSDVSQSSVCAHASISAHTNWQ